MALPLPCPARSLQRSQRLPKHKHHTLPIVKKALHQHTVFYHSLNFHFIWDDVSGKVNSSIVLEKESRKTWVTAGEESEARTTNHNNILEEFSLL